MRLWESYYTPHTVEEALSLLASHAGNARIIAGGTDLMIDMQYSDKHHVFGALVDVTQIPEMNPIAEDNGWCTIGAAVTHTTIVKTAFLESRATCLVESCGVVGGPQVRNVGTLGGNVAHALPAGDGTTSLIALDAQALVAWGDKGREWLPLAQLFKGAGVSALDHSRDVLIAFKFRLCGAHQGSAFKRIMRPQGVALPVLGCAVWVELDEQGDVFADVRVCVSPVAPVPTRAAEVESVLRGQPTSDDILNRAVEAAYDTLEPRTSKYRATAKYREYMTETLLRKALPLAVERARTGIAKAEGVGMG